MIKVIAKILVRVNSSVFTFFSGVFVSFDLNLFTGIILDRSISFNPYNIFALLLILVGSFLLVLEPIVQQKFIEEVNRAKIINISLDQLMKVANVRAFVVKLIFLIGLALLFFVGGIFLFYVSVKKYIMGG